jgi:hypothetical protein
VQGLRFGTLTPGLVTQIQVTDNVGRAAVEVVGRGPGDGELRAPHRAAHLRRRAVLPLHFGPGDGLIVVPGTGRGHGFDPRVPYSFQLPASQGQASIYLGGAAAPTPGQRPGAYEGEITVTVTISNGNT